MSLFWKMRKAVFFLVLLEYNWFAVLCFYCTAKWICYIFQPLSHTGHYRVLSGVPCALQKVLQFSCSVVSDSLWPHGLQHTRPPCPSQLLEFTQTHVHWVGDAIQPPHPLSSPLLLPSVFPSIRVFSNESVLLIRWPKYWSLSFRISPSNEYSGLFSFSMDWVDLLAVQGTLKSLLQHHSSKASIRRRSAFFIVQLWYPYMTTGKNHSFD